jgi:hypothetical protein
MKRLSLLSVLVTFAFVIGANAQNNDVKQSKNSQDAPYKIAHNNLSIGNMAYSRMVLAAWKDFDNNTLENSAAIFADDIVATFPDGTMVKGKEAFMKMGKEYRSSLASVSSTVDACTTLKSPDNPDIEVVSIWGVETDTSKDGKVTKTHLNEVWFFNKQGKVTEMHQMSAKDTVGSK